jgi:hypothetical protein
MAKKNKTTNSSLSLKGAFAWMVGTLLTCLGLAFGYKTTGAGELRIQIYQPLYNDVVSAQHSLRAVSNEKYPAMKAVHDLQKSGAFGQIPSHIQSDVLKASQGVSAFQASISNVRDLALREMSARILQIRTEKKDRIWRQKIERILRGRSMAQKGFSDTVTLLSNAQHEMVSPIVDMRNPKQAVISGPGGPIFVIRDWLTYPESIKTIDSLWTDEAFLYFNDQHLDWYYRMTREDLKLHNTNLADFLREPFSVMEKNPDFQLLMNSRSTVLSDLEKVKSSLEDRIQDPKQIRDLFSS